MSLIFIFRFDQFIVWLHFQLIINSTHKILILKKRYSYS